MPAGPEVRVPRLIVSQRIRPTLPLLATKSGCTLSEVSVILEIYFKGKMNHCILYSLTTFYYFLFYYTKGTLTWWLKAFNPLIMALLHKFWSLENSMACPLSAKSNNNQTC